VTGSTISVLPGAFAAAGTLYGQNHDAAMSVVTTLAKVLDSQWGCGGTDDSGHKWCDKYDPAALNAVATATDVVNALGKLNDLLQVDSVNHANADNGSHFDPNASNQIQPPPPTAYVDAPAFKGAYGGDTDAPFGWGLISRWLQGRMWPNGDSGKLRTVSSAWEAAKVGMSGAKTAVANARRIVNEQVSGEVAQILTQIDIVDAAIDNVISQCDELSLASVDYAQAIDTAHAKIFRELGEFIAIAGAGQPGAAAPTTRLAAPDPRSRRLRPRRAAGPITSLSGRRAGMPVPAVQNSSSDQGIRIGNGKPISMASESFGDHLPVRR